MATINFEDGTIGSGWTFNPTGASVVNDTDTGGGTTKALRLPDISDNENATAEIDLDTGDGDVVIRFRASTEGTFDEVFITLDGNDVELGRFSGDLGYIEISKTVSAGIHTLLFDYKKDFSVSRNEDTVFISSITFPSNFVAQNFNAKLLDRNENPLSNFSGIKYRWYDASPVVNFDSFSTEGTDGTTDSNGNFSLSIQSALSSGTSGTLLLETSGGASKGIYSVPFSAGDLILDDPLTTADELFFTTGKPPETFTDTLFDNVAERAITNADYRAELYDQSVAEITGAPDNVLQGITDANGEFVLLKPLGTPSTKLVRIIVTSDPDNAGAATGYSNDDTVTFT